MYESFSHYVTADILVFQNKETAAMLEHTEYPEKILKLFSHVKTSFVAVYHLGKNDPYYVSSSVQKFICLMMS